MKKLGIALPEKLVRKIDEPLEYGDSRSERMRRLIKVGLATESALREHGYRLDHRGTVAAAREGIALYADSDK
jgi:metal-responsive CopG/Arc/MetJ family transcriptional regulator